MREVAQRERGTRQGKRGRGCILRPSKGHARGALGMSPQHPSPLSVRGQSSAKAMRSDKEAMQRITDSLQPTTNNQELTTDNR